ncbi:peptidoglycan DD-metalloendopeptidase family protein [Stomatohabitans albus]|uniref:peptidoglycan DD-metalloendopeptidase family protein n=1 Tax=Stomatohabitans albus TaxID=3110766 RepID=UPI00300BFF25
MNSRIALAFAAIGIGAGSLANPAIGQAGGFQHVQSEHLGGLQFVEQGSEQPAPADNLGDTFAGFDVGDSSGDDQALPQQPVENLDVTPAQPDEMTQRVEAEPDVVAARTNVDRLSDWVKETQANLEGRTRRYEIAQGHATRLLEELHGKPDEIRAAAKRIQEAKDERAKLVRTAYKSPATITKADPLSAGNATNINDSLHSGESIRRAIERADEHIRQLEHAASLDRENFQIASTSARAALAEINELEASSEALNKALEQGNQNLTEARATLEATRKAARARLDAQAAAEAAARAAQQAAQQARTVSPDGTQVVVSPIPAQAQNMNAGWDLWRMATINGAQQVMTCPVGHPVSFIDSWGFPRSGGRTHKGVDMMAAKGTPIYAVADGHVERAYWNRLGGLSINFVDSLGHKYYYAHMDAVYVTDGQQMKVGDVMGAVGNTGNAQSTPPHLHFQFHPNHGGPVPPYELTRSLCGPND